MLKDTNAKHSKTLNTESRYIINIKLHQKEKLPNELVTRTSIKTYYVKKLLNKLIRS